MRGAVKNRRQISNNQGGGFEITKQQPSLYSLTESSTGSFYVASSDEDVTESEKKVTQNGREKPPATKISGNESYPGHSNEAFSPDTAENDVILARKAKDPNQEIRLGLGGFLTSTEPQTEKEENRRKSEDKKEEGETSANHVTVAPSAPLENGENANGGLHGMSLIKRMRSLSRENHYRGSSGHLSSMGLDSTLVYSHVRIMKTKDFHKEIRGKLDVEDYLVNGETFIDHGGSNIANILTTVLDRLRLKEPGINVQETLDSLLNVPLEMIAATMQGTQMLSGGTSVIVDQSWVVIMKALNEINRRHITMIKLKHAVNFGNNSQEVRFVVVVFTPHKEKGTKTVVEIAKSFATLFTNVDFRQRLVQCHDEGNFKQIVSDRMQYLLRIPRDRKLGTSSRKISCTQEPFITSEEMSQSSRRGGGSFFLFRGIKEDLIRKVPYYFSDFTDGLNGPKTSPKVFSATFFLYFACILPAIAIGVVDDANTKHVIGVRKVVLAQAISGITYSLLAGQPLVILLTTAPIAIYTKIMYDFADSFDMNFLAFYSANGIATWFFLTMFSIFNLPAMMKYLYRSVEESFALFVALAYVVDAVKSVYKSFHYHYCNEKYKYEYSANDTIYNFTTNIYKGPEDGHYGCSKASCMLMILLMLATFWLALSLFNFNRSPYLDAAKREILSGYALPFSVLSIAFLAKHFIDDLPVEKFDFSQELGDFELSPLEKLQWWGWGLAFTIGFFLSVLLFIEQNVAASLVCSEHNKIQKGTAFYWDLFLLAQINLFLALFGFPFVHGALPHSPMHVQALADKEQRNHQGVIQDVIVRVRETRVAALIAHLLILLSFFYLLPNPMGDITIPILNGVFLFIAAISLRGNELFDRLLLLFMEQTAYPPHHYVRHVPQRKIHIFTFIQVIQLLILCALGFSPVPYMKMVFPLVVIMFMPIRQKIFPYFIEQQFLDALDGH